jgi:hypothetical protein
VLLEVPEDEVINFASGFGFNTASIFFCSRGLWEI